LGQRRQRVAFIRGSTPSLVATATHNRGESPGRRWRGNAVGALVVSDAGRRIPGTISAGDIVRGRKTLDRDVVEGSLGDLMTPDVISCDIGEPMSRACMDLHQIRHVPTTRKRGLATSSACWTW